MNKHNVVSTHLHFYVNLDHDHKIVVSTCTSWIAHTKSTSPYTRTSFNIFIIQHKIFFISKGFKATLEEFWTKLLKCFFCFYSISQINNTNEINFPRMSLFYPFINVETYTVNLVTYGHGIMRTPPCDHSPITDLKDLSDIEVLSNKNTLFADTWRVRVWQVLL